MVYGFVQRSKGLITVSSKKGMGTTFRIFLPRSRAEETSMKEMETILAMPTGTETILIVDDEDQLLDFSEEVLYGLGYKVIRL